MQDLQIAEPVESEASEPVVSPDAEAEMRRVNSVDATAHQPLVLRVQTRKLELESVLASLAEGNLTTRSDISFALSTVNDLLTGDLEHIPAVVAVDLNRWLERTKHVAGHATVPAVAPTAE